MRRFDAAFDAQDVDAVMALMTSDCVFDSTAPPDGIRYEGQDAVRAAWTEFFAGSEGTQFRTESITGYATRWWRSGATTGRAPRQATSAA